MRGLHASKEGLIVECSAAGCLFAGQEQTGSAVHTGNPTAKRWVGTTEFPPLDELLVVSRFGFSFR
jgi:hypothetical protein